MRLLKICMTGFLSLIAKVVAGHIMHGTIRADFNPETSGITSRSSK
jgi:hypothetical protein